MRRTALGFILTIAVGVGLGAFSAVVVARDSDTRLCTGAEFNQALRNFLENYRELLVDFPAQYSEPLVSTVSDNARNIRYEFDPSVSSVSNIDLHLAALADCAAGGRASRDGPSIVVLEVEPVGCGSDAENQRWQDFFENARKRIVSGAASEAPSETAGSDLAEFAEFDLNLRLRFYDEELARLAACAPEG